MDRIHSAVSAASTDVGDLPLHGSQIGDMYEIGPNLWALSTIANSTRVGWVDPCAGIS